MPQQVDSTGATSSPGTRASAAATSPSTPERFLVAVAVDQDAAFAAAAAKGLLAGQAPRAPGTFPAARRPAPPPPPPAPGASAGHSSASVWRHEGSRPTMGRPASACGASTASARSASTRASSTAPTARKVRPQHSGRFAPPPPGRRARDAHPPPGGAQQLAGGAGDLRLEPRCEGIDEQHRLRAAPRRFRRFETGVGRPARQGAGGAQAEPRPRRRGARAASGRAARTAPGGARQPRRGARQPADGAVAPRKAARGGAAAQHFDLHARHVDSGGTFAAARLAADAQRHRLGHGVRLQRAGAELSGERVAQRVGAPARDVGLVAGGAV